MEHYYYYYFRYISFWVVSTRREGYSLSSLNLQFIVDYAVLILQQLPVVIVQLAII